MAASPAKIVRACLVNAKAVIMPPTGMVPGQMQQPGDDTTLCFIGQMPDTPDQILYLANTAGLLFGRLQKGNKQRMIHPGLKGIVRHLDPDDGFVLASSLLDAIQALTSVTVKVDEVNHYISGVYPVSGVISLGEEIGKRRFLWSFNLRIAFKDLEPSLG